MIPGKQQLSTLCPSRDASVSRASGQAIAEADPGYGIGISFPASGGIYDRMNPNADASEDISQNHHNFNGQKDSSTV